MRLTTRAVNIAVLLALLPSLAPADPVQLDPPAVVYKLPDQK